MKKIWTNGCFDILHIGHIRLFKYAKSLGDYLIVGIDSDRRVKQLKGRDRPYNTESFRKEFLESIKYIDNVVIFDTYDDLKDIVRKENIDTIVVGDEYSTEDVGASSLVAEVKFFPKTPNKSTTNILEYENK